MPLRGCCVRRLPQRCVEHRLAHVTLPLPAVTSTQLFPLFVDRLMPLPQITVLPTCNHHHTLLRSRNTHSRCLCSCYVVTVATFTFIAAYVLPVCSTRCYCLAGYACYTPALFATRLPGIRLLLPGTIHRVLLRYIRLPLVLLPALPPLRWIACCSAFVITRLRLRWC